MSELDDPRRRFVDSVAELRPALHAYCARMTGSVFDGEDIVQDTLAKAHDALATMAEEPPLRPWLFRIAHNTAMDFLRRYDRKHVELVGEVPDRPGNDEEPGIDGSLVEAALAVFVQLPPIQRSALVLKDVLGHSLEQTAEIMGTTVAAVKSALVRARAHVASRAAEPDAPVAPDEQRAALRRYADLFNARDWDGLRTLLAEEVRLDLVSRQQRRGPAASIYFDRYAEITGTESLRAEVGNVDGVPALAVFRNGSTAPAYFILLGWDNGKVAVIRDFRYVPYVANAARFRPL